MYDRNGLQLSTARTETLNTYRMTSVDLTTKKYRAYARSGSPNPNKWTMHDIGRYNDPRDAAHVAQEFEKQYTKDQVSQMVLDGAFSEIAKVFRETIDIPEWKYPAEGLLIEDILNDYGYEKNYVLDAKEALREVIKVFNLKAPNLNDIKTLVETVEKLYQTGISYRTAAKQTMGVI